MSIIKLFYNWFATPEFGEDYARAIVGEKFFGESIVVKITEKNFQDYGDKFFYDIHLENGNVIRVFNPNTVYMSPNPMEESND